MRVQTNIQPAGRRLSALLSPFCEVVRTTPSAQSLLLSLWMWGVGCPGGGHGAFPASNPLRYSASSTPCRSCVNIPRPVLLFPVPAARPWRTGGSLHHTPVRASNSTSPGVAPSPLCMLRGHGPLRANGLSYGFLQVPYALPPMGKRRMECPARCSYEGANAVCAWRGGHCRGCSSVRSPGRSLRFGRGGKSIASRQPVRLPGNDAPPPSQRARATLPLVYIM
mmetsp:Transcript_130387/g.225416  ORF Transcript_130387/g.225416 Transcript_130387/m.225416 type:complete len:223 (+) Transcript_130387:370-1038(+)